MTQKKRIVILILIAVGLSVLAGCGVSHRVKNGVLRDTLFSVEETNNGFWRIWMTHDDIAGYCTRNKAVGEYALKLLREHDGDVIVTFRSINEGDPEYSWWDQSDCGTVSGGDSSTEMFLLDKIEPLPARTGY